MIKAVGGVGGTTGHPGPRQGEKRCRKHKRAARSGPVVGLDLRLVSRIVCEAAHERDPEQGAREQAKYEQPERVSARYVGALVGQHGGELGFRELPSQILADVDHGPKQTDGEGGDREPLYDTQASGVQAGADSSSPERISGLCRTGCQRRQRGPRPPPGPVAIPERVAHASQQQQVKAVVHWRE